MTRISAILLAGVAALGFASATQAADLIVDYAPVSPGVIDVGGDWDGAYVGVFGGFGWGTADHTNAVAPSPCAPTDGCDVDMSGWLLGATAGANFTVGSGLILGVAGDIAWSNVSGEDTSYPAPADYVANGVDWEGSLRGVVGFDGGSFMPYLTAGFAVAHAWHESDLGDGYGEATHLGWTAGVGVAVAVAENVTLDLQYRHSWYDEQEYDMDFAPNNPVFGLSTDRVTAGINFNF